MQAYDDLRSSLEHHLSEVRKSASAIRTHGLGQSDLGAKSPVHAPFYEIGHFFNTDWMRGAVPHRLITNYGIAVEYTDDVESFVTEAVERALAALTASEEAL